MKEIRWADKGSSTEIFNSLNSNESFTIVLEGSLANVLGELFGGQQNVLTPEKVKLILGVAALLAISGLLLFAMSKGYKISGKASTENGNSYEIILEKVDK